MSSREYPAHPIPGVGVIAFNDDAVLLIRRGQEPRRGEWSIPGGAVEVGETVRAAAMREFAEECGGEIQLRGLVDAIDIITRDANGAVHYHYVVVDFWADWRGGELRAQSDVMDARWVNLNELATYELPQATREMIEKAVVLRNDSK